MVSYVFKRYENKYILTPEQYETILREVEKRMGPDEFGETTIQSLYYDTPTCLLIRNSILKPKYKEKIRVRSYGLATPDSKVYLELKPDQREKNIRITLPEDLDYTGVFDDIFEKYTERAELMRVKTINMGSMFRVYYNVKLKVGVKEKEFIDEIRIRNGNLEVSAERVDYRKNEL